MRSPRLVHVDGHAPLVRDRNHPRDIRGHSRVGRTDQCDKLSGGVRIERRGDIGGGDAEADVEIGMQPGCDIDRPGAAQDQPDEERLVQIATDDHLVAGLQRRQQIGMVAGG